MNPETVRLNKHLALQLGISRREADDLIANGKVCIDGQVATLGSRVTTTTDITVDGAPLQITSVHRYVLFNKPISYVCSRRAQGDNPTIYDLLPPDMYALKPVGRLDKDSSGLLLLTNDGDFAHRMTHPSFRKVKIYEVTIDATLQPLHQQMIADFGIELPDGPSRLALESLNSERTEWRVTMHEGRNRQIRRTFAALGYDVTKLHRTHFGSYELSDLPSGEYRVTSTG